MIASGGGATDDVLPSADVGFDPGWSPDGKAIVLTLNVAGDPPVTPSGPGIAIADLLTKKVSLLQGAAGQPLRLVSGRKIHCCRHRRYMEAKTVRSGYAEVERTECDADGLSELVSRRKVLVLQYDFGRRSCIFSYSDFRSQIGATGESQGLAKL